MTARAFEPREGALPLANLPPLPRAFYARATQAVARDLLGKLIVRRRPDAGLQAGRIVEVEAYLGERDQASHARRGPTPRAAIMFGPPGFLYVYFIYGMHHCMNVVTETDGIAGAVLIRAAEPIAGFDDAADRKGRRPLTGPGKLCAALGITIRHKGQDLTRPDPADAIYLADDGRTRPRRATSPRIGVDYAGPWADRKLRYFVPNNNYVCRP